MSSKSPESQALDSLFLDSYSEFGLELELELELEKDKDTSKVVIDKNFQDFDSLVNYKCIIIREWRRQYPLPPLPDNIILLELNCDYNFSLNNLPNSIRIIYIRGKLLYPLGNLPNNLYKLYFNLEYSFPLDNIPESVKILNLCGCTNQSSLNLPVGLKELQFVEVTFDNDEVIAYPPTLEILDLQRFTLIYSDMDLEKSLEQLNLLNIPLSLRRLDLPSIELNNMDDILSRLVNLEELNVFYRTNTALNIFPPNLKRLFIGDGYQHDIINLPPSVTYVQIGSQFAGSLSFITDSNIEHLELDYNDTISIIDYKFPKTLKQITILETHYEIRKIAERYPHIKICTIPDWDYHSDLVDFARRTE
jgi:hypothetical protein